MEAKPIRHPLLYGEYELTIDEKNRLPVPAGVRKALDPEIHGEAFFMVMGVNKKPWLYPKGYYQELVTLVPSDMTPGEDMLAFDQMNFAMASPLEWDAQGRVLIPEKTLRRTGLNKEVTLIGVRDHLELWNRSEWETRRDELLSRSSEIALRAKQARLSPNRSDASPQRDQ
jgi:MraZ protein